MNSGTSERERELLDVNGNEWLLTIVEKFAHNTTDSVMNQNTKCVCRPYSVHVDVD